MPKLHSISESRWTRFRAFLRGLLLYNTVYWRRASDAVNRRASRVNRAERTLARPQVDPEILRPRAKPRVHGAAAQAIVPPPAMPAGDARRGSSPADEIMRGDWADAETPPPGEQAGSESADLSAGESGRRRRRRVYRRKQKGLGGGTDPLRGLARGNAGRPGWWRRLLGLG